jgi:D-amino-acid dehydrogenase
VTVRVAGGIYFPKDACFQPEAYMSALQKLCEKAGVTFQWNTNVEALDVRGNRIAAVETPRGNFSADEIVLCGGVWSPEVVGELGLKIPIQAGKGYSLTIIQPREMPEVCAILTEARLAVTPMGLQLRVAGTMELAGLNDKINQTRVQGIIRSFKKYFPEFSSKDFVEAETWRGLRPCSPDGLPYLGRTEKFSNLILATGHTMMGMSLSPITGKIVSEIVSGEKPAFDLGLLSPDRFA